VGCKRNFTIKVDDDATDEDIDQEVHEYAVQNFIEASWTEADR
jgi:hypothetical protein